ncbi:ribosome silencing factor [Carboxylicivirga sediminis]|uniref:Ribosomal silencing factor RsfS n=1 Tax=Carboxylicivirga sediminis TaxID=2006564 RepID=A0A941F3N9_9BACT|nr:ribosome silencing factor [Carboxylicivirga sediminis]MBR8534725.1 ribosome silencing factor [Carboxylicivirga sediminis]
MNEENYSAKQLADAIVEGIQDKKGTNIAILDLSKLDNTICQYFVICDGESTTQVDAIADGIEDYVRKHLGDKPNHVEGRENALWILLDYFDVVVHVFHKEQRGYYNLEALWADAKRTDIENLF